MAAINPESTTFQRSEAWTLLASKGSVPWRQQWVPYGKISDHLKRAVIASEDDGFVNHEGVDWAAIEKPGSATPRPKPRSPRPRAAPRPPGACAQDPRRLHHHPATGQNLLLSGERTLLRKGRNLCSRCCWNRS